MWKEIFQPMTSFTIIVAYSNVEQSLCTYVCVTTKVQAQPDSNAETAEANLLKRQQAGPGSGKPRPD